MHTLTDAFNDYLQSREHHLQPATVRAYRRIWEKHVNPPYGKTSLADITLDLYADAYHNPRITSGAYELLLLVGRHAWLLHESPCEPPNNKHARREEITARPRPRTQRATTPTPTPATRNPYPTLTALISELQTLIGTLQKD